MMAEISFLVTEDTCMKKYGMWKKMDVLIPIDFKKGTHTEE